MNRVSRIIFLLFAIGVALGVSYYVYTLLNKQPAIVEKATDVEFTTIAVALQGISKGHKLTSKDLRFSKYLTDTLPKGAFTQENSPIGRVAIADIQSSEPILDNKLAPTEITKGGLAAVITPTKRAMSVKVDQVVGVAGFIQPGQMVDVLVSIMTKEEKENFMTKTVLENVLVLAVGTQAQAANDKKKSEVVNVVTLEVSPDESENLALAVSKGRIVLALRGYTDLDNVLTKGATVPDLLDRYRTDEDVVTVAPAPAAKPRQLTVRPKQKFVREVVSSSTVNYFTIEGR